MAKYYLHKTPGVECIATENISSGALINISYMTGEVFLARYEGLSFPYGFAARNIKKGESVWYGFNNNTDDVIIKQSKISTLTSS